MSEKKVGQMGKLNGKQNENYKWEKNDRLRELGSFELELKQSGKLLNLSESLCFLSVQWDLNNTRKVESRC